MSDPRAPYYTNLTNWAKDELSNSLLVFALKRDWTFYQLYEYVFDNDLHKEAAILSLKECRRKLRNAINGRFLEKDKDWIDRSFIDGICAEIGYKRRHTV